MKRSKRAHHAILFYCLASALTVGLLVFGLRAPQSLTLNTETQFQNISNDWVFTLDGVQTTLADVGQYSYGPDADSITITRTLPEYATTQCLLFYTEHQEVSVSVGGAIVYTYEIPSGFSFLQTPGNTWHSIALGPDTAGQSISITFSCAFSRYQVLPSDLFFLYPGELQIAQAYSIWFCNTVALFMIILAIVSYLNSRSWKNSLLKVYTQRLGLVYCIIGLWLLAEINIATLVLRNDITTYLFSMLLIRLLPLSFYYFLQTLSPHNTRWSNWLEWVFAANVFVPFLLQFTLQISLLETLPANYLLVLISALVVLAQMGIQLGKHLAARRAPNLYDLLHWSGALLLFGVLGEIYCYANYTRLGGWHGTAISVAAILYTIVSRVILVKIETHFERETETLARENTKLQLLPLMQQINAHFLFNTLNNISFLCKRDPKAADESVLLLAQYMREYMFLINTSDFISFSHEQSLMEAYLTIQQIRFKKNFSFSIEGNISDFYLPPLCIQPFVENAILHGLRNKQGGGHLSISYQQDGSFLKITIQDNGAGFDTAILQHSSRVGIQNVKKRLALYGGWVAIDSTSSGTTVDVFVPQEIQLL